MAGIILYTAFFGVFLVSIGILVQKGHWYGLFDTGRLSSGLFWLVFLTGSGVQAGVIAKFKGFGERDNRSLSEMSLTEVISNTQDFAKDTPSFKSLLDEKESQDIDNCPKCGTNCLPTDAFCQDCGVALNHCDTCGNVELED